MGKTLFAVDDSDVFYLMQYNPFDEVLVEDDPHELRNIMEDYLRRITDILENAQVSV